MNEKELFFIKMKHLFTNLEKIHALFQFKHVLHSWNTSTQISNSVKSKWLIKEENCIYYLCYYYNIVEYFTSVFCW